MFGHFGTALRFFALGIGVGLLTAPRRGEETRAMLRRQALSLLGMSEDQVESTTSRMQGGMRHAQRTVRQASDYLREAAGEVQRGVIEVAAGAHETEPRARSSTRPSTSQPNDEPVVGPPESTSESSRSEAPRRTPRSVGPTEAPPSA